MSSIFLTSTSTLCLSISYRKYSLSYCSNYFQFFIKYTIIKNLEFIVLCYYVLYDQLEIKYSNKKRLTIKKKGGFLNFA